MSVEDQPVAKIHWIPIEKVRANSYNPNSVAINEMRLLYHSIKADGYTQPVVTIIDGKCDFSLPCGHVSQVEISEWRNQNAFLFLLRKSGSVGIRLASLMRTEVCPRFTIAHSQKEKVVSESTSHKPSAITESQSVDGLKNSGVSAPSISTKKAPTAQSGCGTSLELTKWFSFSQHVCRTCMSSERKPGDYWITSGVTLQGYAEESGLIMSWLSSGASTPHPHLPISLDDLCGRWMESALKEMNLDFQRLHGIYVGEANDHSIVVIVDGFHRYLTMKTYPDVQAMTGGLLPCVVLNKSINERMASTVRHNRARGKHSIAGMSNMVFQMLENGMDDQQIMTSLGLEAEELARLKYVTGFAKLFENVDYRKAWATRRMIQLEKAARNGAEDAVLSESQKD